MLSNIWNLVLYKPLLNALGFLVSVMPGGDVGLAIVTLTVLVKLALFPFSQHSIESQAKVKKLEPELAIQLPIIFALYYVFYKGINFDGSVLYAFIHAPAHLNMSFLGILDIAVKNNLILAIAAGVSQYFQAVSMPQMTVAASGSDGKSFQENLSKSMNMNMKYFFPFIIAFFAYSLPGAVALYWITSNIFIIGQQLYVERKAKQEENK